jgi:hypothetical protein
MWAKILSLGNRLNLTLFEKGLTPIFSNKLWRNGYGIDCFFYLLEESILSFKDYEYLSLNTRFGYSQCDGIEDLFKIRSFSDLISSKGIEKRFYDGLLVSNIESSLVATFLYFLEYDDQ